MYLSLSLTFSERSLRSLRLCFSLSFRYCFYYLWVCGIFCCHSTRWLPSPSSRRRGPGMEAVAYEIITSENGGDTGSSSRGGGGGGGNGSRSGRWSGRASAMALASAVVVAVVAVAVTVAVALPLTVVVVRMLGKVVGAGSRSRNLQTSHNSVF